MNLNAREKQKVVEKYKMMLLYFEVQIAFINITQNHPQDSLILQNFWMDKHNTKLKTNRLEANVCNAYHKLTAKIHLFKELL